jgi:hypothetical protein
MYTGVRTLLDRAGNSVRGQRITTFLSERIGRNLSSSAPRVDPAPRQPLAASASSAAGPPGR